MNTEQNAEYIVITQGLRGYYVSIFDDVDGPIQSGHGSYSSFDEALPEAIGWAQADEVRLGEAVRARAVELGLIRDEVGCLGKAPIAPRKSSGLKF